MPSAVQAATVTVPKLLTAAWMMMLDREYMEPCTAAGTPRYRMRRREAG